LGKRRSDKKDFGRQELKDLASPKVGKFIHHSAIITAEAQRKQFFLPQRTTEF
jgi:hypothetical protein